MIRQRGSRIALHVSRLERPGINGSGAIEPRLGARPDALKTQTGATRPSEGRSLRPATLGANRNTWSYYNDCVCNEPTVWGALDAKVGGEPLELDKVYRVTTNDFLAGGQDEWTTFADGTNRENTYVDMQEVVNNYVAARSPIAPAVEGRITQVAVPAELPAAGSVPIPPPIVLTAAGFALAGGRRTGTPQARLNG